MSKALKISEAEWTVMQILWRSSPCTSASITTELSKEKNWSPTTVQTLLSRLVDKKTVNYEKVNRIHHYYPLVTETNCLREERQSFLNRLYKGSLSSMLAGFLEDEKLTENEIDQLQKLLEKQKE